jgi:hypothetical protein
MMRQVLTRLEGGRGVRQIFDDSAKLILFEHATTVMARKVQTNCPASMSVRQQQQQQQACTAQGHH